MFRVTDYQMWQKNSFLENKYKKRPQLLGVVSLSQDQHSTEASSFRSEKLNQLIGVVLPHFVLQTEHKRQPHQQSQTVRWCIVCVQNFTSHFQWCELSMIMSTWKEDCKLQSLDSFAGQFQDAHRIDSRQWRHMMMSCRHRNSSCAIESNKFQQPRM